MRLLQTLCILILFVAAVSAQAASARILIVLPTYIDKAGRHATTPSLYERDAYQAVLRKSPELRTGMRFDVRWKLKDVDWNKVEMRLELRGVTKNEITSTTIK